MSGADGANIAPAPAPAGGHGPAGRRRLVTAPAERDWYAWHAPYDDPASGLSRRLAWAQDRIRAALDEAPARQLAASAGLQRVEVVTGDASLTSQYADMVAAGLVLACGLFGNMTDADIERAIGFCAQLCATGGTVIWTRGRWEPDVVPQVCAWFEERGFERVWLSGPEHLQCCGAHRFTAAPAPLERDAVMFRFTGHDVRRGPDRGA